MVEKKMNIFLSPIFLSYLPVVHFSVSRATPCSVKA